MIRANLLLWRYRASRPPLKGLARTGWGLGAGPQSPNLLVALAAFAAGAPLEPAWIKDQRRARTCYVRVRGRRTAREALIQFDPNGLEEKVQNVLPYFQMPYYPDVCFTGIVRIVHICSNMAL